MADYEQSEVVSGIAKRMIDLYHHHLKGAAITYVMKLKEEGKEIQSKPGRKQKIAVAMKVPPLWHCLTGFVFVIRVDQRWWDFLSLKQQEAVVDHELCHCRQDENGWSIRKHDVEEFKDILERHGFWCWELENFVLAHRPAEESKNEQ